MPTRPVISGIGVMTSRTRVSAHSATGMKRRSRLVMMPSSVWSVVDDRQAGDAVLRRRSASSSSSVASGPMVTGLVIMPVWVRLTRSTW